MRFRDLHFKLKAVWLRRLKIGDGRRKKKKPSWITPVSYGYHTVDRFSQFCTDGLSDTDMVLVQREQIEDLEIWFFGVSDAQIGNGISKYLQTHLFDKLACESGIMRKCKETLRRAHKGSTVKITATYGEDEKQSLIGGSSAASVMVVNGEKLTMANMGSHRIVVCRDGKAHQIKNKYQKSLQNRWSHFIFPAACHLEHIEDEAKSTSFDLTVTAGTISSNMDFIIIASAGIWEVMNNQEAVNLISHIKDPQQAARCLAKEALNRMSKTGISCIVIRFD